MGECWAVACAYQFKITCIADAMKLVVRHIHFSRVRANSARMLHSLALPQYQVWISQRDYQLGQIMMTAIIDGSRCSIDIALKCVSTKHQRVLAVYQGKCIFQFVADIHLIDIGCLEWQKCQWHAHFHILRTSVNRESTIHNFASSVIDIQIAWTHPVI
jgi:hypothetical protein